MKQLPSVLLVGDIRSSKAAGSPFEQDMPTAEEVDNLTNWLAKAGYHVDVEPDVRSFVRAGNHDSLHIVFPLWRAGPSRNRTGIVPAICEARGLPYVGGDAFVQAVCQDKALSKVLVRTAGLTAPNEIVIRSAEAIDAVCVTDTLDLPIVVKPLYSACSIGVEDSSLCATENDAKKRAFALFESGLGPVICEEFVPGDEVCLCCLEDHGRIVERCVAVYRNNDGVCPFRDGLLTFEEKVRPNPSWKVTEAASLINADTWSRAETLLKSLGKVDLFRVDGRLRDGVFTVIELTPDIHLGTDSPFLGGFNAAGKCPTTILGRLIQLSFSNQPEKSPWTASREI